MDIPLITDQDDKAMIESMEGITVSGKIILPSGLEIPQPPPNKLWLVAGGELTITDL